MSVQLLSLEEAQARMPLLKSITTSICDTWENVLKVKMEVAKDCELVSKTSPNAVKNYELSQEQKDLMNYHVDRLNAYVREVEELGGFVQEIARGVVVIPTLLHGRKVFFSIQPIKEKVINYFQELDESFVDRQKIGIMKRGFLLKKPKE